MATILLLLGVWANSVNISAGLFPKALVTMREDAARCASLLVRFVFGTWTPGSDHTLEKNEEARGMQLSTAAEGWYYGSAFISLYQVELFSENELKRCHSAPVRAVDNRPRWQRSAVWKSAEDLAWTFRRLFHPRDPQVNLRGLWIQAFRMFRAGYTPDEIAQAMAEAAARGPRAKPATLWFFVGWIRRLRSFKTRMLREAEARDRRWQQEKQALEPARPLWGAAANADGLVGLRHLLAGLVPALGRAAP